VSRRQGADSDPGFSGGRQRPQVAGDAGLVAGFNCFAVCGVACAEGGVETVFDVHGRTSVALTGEGEIRVPVERLAWTMPLATCL
jgi:hypothetical protein